MACKRWVSDEAVGLLGGPAGLGGGATAAGASGVGAAGAGAAAAGAAGRVGAAGTAVCAAPAPEAPCAGYGLSPELCSALCSAFRINGDWPGGSGRPLGMRGICIWAASAFL